MNNMKLLMHMCCAPCSVYPLEVLRRQDAQIEGFFYNPNIHPIEEHRKRMENVRILSEIKGLKVHYSDEFRQELWENFEGFEASRCAMCYSMRLDKAAAFAAENGFDAFTTSLLVSPYQKHELIRELGEKYALKHGVKFYYVDFRPGFRQGQQKAKNLGLYRQKFCGCIKSLRPV
jgi:predicted adenine nucleotide alpha hydrolase (AANH) superfamily ATPase